MLKWILGLGWFMGMAAMLQAQTVGIGRPADPSARLEVYDTTRGILIPRLTTQQRQTHLTTPVPGLLIYNVDCQVFQYWDGSQWVTLLPATQQLAAGWCSALSAWQYRIPIQITNPATYDMTDVEIPLIVNTAGLISAGKLQPDGADLRFTDATCTSLPYYIENGLNTTTTRIWVRIPSIPASSTITIYMYYGNPSALPGSDPVATFHFWDDFTTLTQWTLPAGTQFLHYGDTLRINGGTVARSGFAYLNTALPFNLNDGYFLEARIRYYAPSTGNNYSGVLEANSAQLGGCGSNSCGNAVIHYMRGYTVRDVAWWAGTGATTSYNIGSANCWLSQDSIWYVLGIQIFPNQVLFYRDYSLMCNSGTFTSWAKNLQWIILGYFCNNCGVVDIQDTDYDWVRVRKTYRDNPAIVYGTEERMPCY